MSREPDQHRNEDDDEGDCQNRQDHLVSPFTACAVVCNLLSRDSLWGEVNDFLISACARSPRQLRALLNGSPQVGELGDDTPTELGMAGREGGLGAVELLRVVEPDRPADVLR